ncbi:hypothetical protein AGABI2DRAFT_178597 [Agaricus bisporus var. bisporus H97]|uniref:hypothetical protein n=1 Tax=Agaricus bisporus var. bisporus (strain H97 / ATCC MYA-4626 / FGSC 10389) TaxID=936046 RepID=UPI00029F6040|nr:hypothetical protein AGABI2DRAFT_178597 [Agaricus bisporus var. bisporus H97]EKV47789.1 hypothetical protein AGABI2DRAFT_178597 [Agaricus bisporus var. bisporus H97]
MAIKNPEHQALLHNNVASPPPYIGYPQTGVAYVPHGHPAPIIVHPNIPSKIVVVREDRRRCRFLKVFVVAILFFCLLKTITLSWLWREYQSEPHVSAQQWAIGPGAQSPDYPIPAGAELVSCEQPLKNGNADTRLNVDPSSEAILLMAQGPRLQGSVKITTGKHDSVKFFVRLTAYDGEDKDTIVCSLKRANGESGVGIFNPRRHWRYKRSVKYDVVVEFPENHPTINRFETNVVNSGHSIDDIKNKVLFETLTLRGSNGGIHSKSVAALRANIVTSNGIIEGYYNGSDDLGLHTSNGKIDVDIDFSQVKSSTANLLMTTSNGRLRAGVRLHDRTSGNAGTDFKVISVTTNAHLDFSFLEVPLYSTLHHQASTSNSPATVTMHPTFEGRFSLASSSLFTPVINEHRVEDPYGKDRHRIVTRRTFRGLVEGDVSWGGDTKGDGSVHVSTSNGKLTLNL